MKLSLENFRCHARADFEFPLEGLVSLSGQSGSGKSTILSAIVYVLYNKIPGKCKKPYTHGKNTSKVELRLPIPTEDDETGETDSLFITRTSRPNRLLVTQNGVEYEDDAAQGIIETALGMNYEEFMAASYIVQRSNASVLSMTPMEQVKFIEILAACGPTVEEYKMMIKEKIKELRELKLKKQGEFESLTLQLEEKEEIEEPDIPEEIQNGIDPKIVRRELSKYEKELEKVKKAISKAQNDIEGSRTLEKEINEAQKKIEKNKGEIEFYNNLITQLGDIPTAEEFGITRENLLNAKKDVENFEKQIKFHKDVLNMHEAIKEHNKATLDRIKILESDLLSEHEILKLEENLETISNAAAEYESKKKLFEKASLQKENSRKAIGIVFRKIREEFSSEGGYSTSIKTPLKMLTFLNFLLSEKKAVSPKKIYMCPCCENKVCFDQDELIPALEIEKYEENVEEKIEKIRTFINEIESHKANFEVLLENPGDIKPDVTSVTKDFLKAKRIREEYDTLSNSKLSSVLIKMKERLEKEALLYDLTTDEEQANLFIETYNETREDLLNIAAALTKDLAYSESIIDTFNEHTKEIEKRKKIIKSIILPPAKEIGRIKTLEKELSTQTQNLCSVNLEITKRRDILDSVAEYEHYQNYLYEIEMLGKKIKKCERELAKLDSKLEGYHGLEDISKQAEILALEETVKSINEHARIYLDQMFEDPIFIRLKCTKELASKKGTKLQMNTSIDYKGNSYENVEELSGGERQRCDIAFLLAVSDMLGGRLLLLDECLNNLDSNINTDILSFIRELCGNKLIVVISHEAVKGLFTDEIHIG